jgi:hypothetical protein
LTDFSFSVLTYIGGSLAIEYNPTLVSFTMPKLEYIGGEVSVCGNVLLGVIPENVLIGSKGGCRFNRLMASCPIGSGACQ